MRLRQNICQRTFMLYLYNVCCIGMSGQSERNNFYFFDRTKKQITNTDNIIDVLVTKEKQRYLCCSQNNLNFRLKTEPVTAGADAMLHVWFLWHTIYHCIVPVMTGAVFMLQRFGLFLGRCLNSYQRVLCT